jgi:hypothetical protein
VLYVIAASHEFSISSPLARVIKVSGSISTIYFSLDLASSVTKTSLQ